MYQGLLEPITNRQTWTDTFQVVDDNRAAVNLAAATIGVYVRQQTKKNYTNDYGVSTSASSSSFALQGSTSDGHVTFPNGGTDGIFSWTFTDAETRKLCPVTHDVSVYITIAAVVTPFVLATIAVYDGVKP